MSWKPEVQTDGTGKWYANALAFATLEEAERSARDLMLRWTAVRDYRAVLSEDPVSHSYSKDGELAPVTAAKEPTDEA